MAQWYEETVGQLEPEFRKATDALLAVTNTGPGTKLLDLACGPGHTTAAAAATGASVLGVDLSSEMIKAAKRRYPDHMFSVGDMLEPPSGPWDAIVSRFGAHHVNPAWIKAAFAVLKPGGRLAIAEFDGNTEEARANGMQSAGPWENLLAQAGFSQVQSEVLHLDLERFEGTELPVPGDVVLIVSGSKPT